LSGVVFGPHGTAAGIEFADDGGVVEVEPAVFVAEPPSAFVVAYLPI
jgi:hypothetical protein